MLGPSVMIKIEACVRQVHWWRHQTGCKNTLCCTMMLSIIKKAVGLCLYRYFSHHYEKDESMFGSRSWRSKAGAPRNDSIFFASATQPNYDTAAKMKVARRSTPIKKLRLVMFENVLRNFECTLSRHTMAETSIVSIHFHFTVDLNQLFHALNPLGPDGRKQNTK